MSGAAHGVGGAGIIIRLGIAVLVASLGVEGAASEGFLLLIL